MKKYMFITIIGLALLFGCVFGFKAYVNARRQAYVEAHKNPIITISSATAQTSVWKQQITAVGSTRTVKGVNVTTELAGMVEKIYFKPGSYVKKGDLLVSLDIKSDEAKLKSLEAIAEYDRTTYKRDIKQYRIGALSGEQLASAKASFESSAANVVEQEATIAKKVIRAPFTGKIGISYVNPGQFIQPGDKITSLETITPIYVDFFVPQTDISKIKVGQQVSVTVDSFPGKEFTGVISTVNPNVETDTRNIEIEATLPNNDKLLLPGMFVNTNLQLGISNTYITLPQAALTFNSYGSIIYILHDTGTMKDNKKVWKVTQSFVTVGPSRGNQVAILKGLKAGDTIVTSGAFKIKNNSLVFINNTVQPLSNPNPQPKSEFQ